MKLIQILLKVFRFYNEAFKYIKEYKDYQFISATNYGIYGVNQISNHIGKLNNGKSKTNKFSDNDQIIINEDIGVYQLRKIIYKNRILTISRYEYKNEKHIFLFKNLMKTSTALSKGSHNGWSTEKNEDDHNTPYLYYITNDLSMCPFRHSNAITIHSSQGSTFDKVAFILPEGSYTKEMIYTAISRCTSSLIIIIQESQIDKVYNCI